MFEIPEGSLKLNPQMPQTHKGTLGGGPPILMPQPLPVHLWMGRTRQRGRNSELPTSSVWHHEVVWILGAQTKSPTGGCYWSENTFTQGFTWVWFQGSWKFCFLSKPSDQNVHSLLRFCFWDSVSFLRDGVVFLWFPSAMTKLLVWPYNWEEEWYRKGQDVRGKRKQKLFFETQ